VARIVWTDQGVRYFDPNPADVAVTEISSGRTKVIARVVIKRRRAGRGREGIEEREELRIEKEKGKPARLQRVSSDVRSTEN